MGFHQDGNGFRVSWRGWMLVLKKRPVAGLALPATLCVTERKVGCGGV